MPNIDRKANKRNHRHSQHWRQLPRAALADQILQLLRRIGDLSQAERHQLDLMLRRFARLQTQAAS